MDHAGFLSIEGDRVRVPRYAFDHGGFRAWATSDQFPDGVRAAFIAGEVMIELSPEELEGHNKVKSDLNIDLGGLVRHEDLGEFYVDGAFLTHVEAELSCEPDLMFVSWASIEAGRVRLVEKATREDRFVELVGTPDLVAEIVSDSSERKDLRELRKAYAAAGIPEYWLIDARGDELRFEILRLALGEYIPSAPADQIQHSDVLGRSFRLERTRNRVGRFRYQLRIEAQS